MRVIDFSYNCRYCTRVIDFSYNANYWFQRQLHVCHMLRSVQSIGLLQEIGHPRTCAHKCFYFACECLVCAFKHTSAFHPVHRKSKVMRWPVWDRILCCHLQPVVEDGRAELQECYAYLPRPEWLHLRDIWCTSLLVWQGVVWQGVVWQGGEHEECGGRVMTASFLYTLGTWSYMKRRFLLICRLPTLFVH